MQMIKLKIEDNVYEQFVKSLGAFPEGSIELENINDPYLKIDPYYYERKERISKLIEDIENGKEPMYDNDEFEKEMDEFEKELELKFGS